MKKLLSIILTAVLVFSIVCCAPASFAEDGRLTFALASDPHIEAAKSTLEVNYPESELYFHGGGSGNLYFEAPALTRAFLKQAEEQDVDFVLFAGDMTRSGTEQEHRTFAKIIEEFEKETGIQAYVVPGNHDFFNSTPAEFKEYYKKACYDDALVVDTETASYTADLPDGYRLIAVDSNNPGANGDGLNDRLFNWIDEQVAAARADGREIIYSMHHPVLEHLTLGKLVMKDFIVRDSNKVAERFCNWGIQYAYTGHEHGNDIAKYVGKNGNTFYDVLTTSLSSYPLEYRIVTYSEKNVELKMGSIDECDFSALVDGYNDEQLALMKSDYNAYAYGLFRYSIAEKILKYTTPEFIKGKLKVEDGILADEIDALMSIVNYALEMPIYDSGDGSLSLEALAAKKNVVFPKADYTSLADLATALVAMHYFGDENRPGSEYPECELFVKALNTGLQFVLTNAAPEAVKAVIDGADLIFGEEYADSICWWFTAAANNSDEVYEIAGAVLYPLLDSFLVDKGPADRDVTLPAVGENLGVQAKIMSYFEIFFRVLEYIFKIVAAAL